MSSSHVLSENTLPQKMSTFGMLLGAQMADAKERLRNGESVDVVLDELYLLTFSDICRTLVYPDPEAVMQELQMSSQMFNTNMDENGEYDDFYEPTFVSSKKMKLSSSSMLMPPQQNQSQFFICNYPKCGKSYSNASDLKSHALRHNAPKLFECAWPHCDFKSAYSSSVGEHIGKQHLKCQTRGPQRDNYLEEAKKHIRKVEEAGEQSSGTLKQSSSNSSSRSSTPIPVGPFYCCDRTFGNLYNLQKHQSSRKCVMMQKQPLEVQEELDTSFAAAAAAAVAAFSHKSNPTDNETADEDVDFLMCMKTEFTEYDNSDD